MHAAVCALALVALVSCSSLVRSETKSATTAELHTERAAAAEEHHEPTVRLVTVTRREPSGAVITRRARTVTGAVDCHETAGETTAAKVDQLATTATVQEVKPAFAWWRLAVAFVLGWLGPPVLRHALRNLREAVVG